MANTNTQWKLDVLFGDDEDPAVRISGYAAITSATLNHILRTKTFNNIFTRQLSDELRLQYFYSTT